KKNCRLATVEFWQALIEPRQSIRRDLRVLPCVALGRVDSHQLPASMFNDVIGLTLKCLFVGPSIGRAEVVVVAYRRVEGDTQCLEGIANPVVLAREAAIRQVAAKQAELSARSSGLHFASDPLKPRPALFIEEVQI